MNTLVIYTHPNHHSLNYAVLQSVMHGAEQNDKINKVKLIDLYGEKFDPVLVFNQEKKRHDLHKDPVHKKYRDLITWADKLIFIYPIWWGRPPAMLLGFFDQIFVNNFAYRNGKSFFHEPLLKGKSAVCISTMKGPANYPLFFLNNAHKALMKKAILKFVGIKQVKFFEFGSAESKPQKQKKNLMKIERYFENRI